MAKVISICLQKGGSAKTTTAINLASNLRELDKRVLLIDMDYQANATFGSGINSKKLQYSLYNVLTTDRQYKCAVEDAIIRTDYYDILPADKDMMDLPLELTSFTALKETIKLVNNQYDYIIIDCPPALNIISQNALTASDYVIIPSEPKPFNFTGLVDMAETIEAVHKYHNSDLKVLGILLVKYNNRTNLTKLVRASIENYAQQLQTTIYDTTIRESVIVSESQLAQQPLNNYAPSAKPTIDYIAFTLETLKRLGDK